MKPFTCNCKSWFTISLNFWSIEQILVHILFPGIKMELQHMQCWIQLNSVTWTANFVLSQVLSFRGFEQKDQKHLIKEVLSLYMFYFKISSNVRA